jgi:subfamily B ATP-binding cassette protein MsbA
MAEIFILLIFFYKAFSRIFTFQIIWQKFNAAIGGIETIKEATKGLDLNREIVGSNKVKHFKENIELKGVNFSYGHKKVLFDINITIPKNKTIGIVGKSGAGKTTLFDILTGLVVPQSGNIIMDGIPYRDLNMRELRRRIGYVTQEPVMFNDTIANNVSLWECDISDILCRKKIKTAAKHANCIEFVNENKDGFETIVGDKGVKLSGGQCQRIAIARELYKEPEIMIFDEATSSLDAESEMFIQRSINSMIGKRTIVVIAHRLSTIKNCDCIYVLKDGRIVEEGSFDELYRDTNSRFYSMCQAQNL